VAAMADCDGIVFLRTPREKTPVIYSPDEEFPIGGSRVVRSSERDQVTLIGAGVTLHEALKAADQLADEEIAARVIDLYSIKPIDAATLVAAANETDRLVTVEDHWPQGGLGEAVLATLADHDTQARVTRLAVGDMPGSATPAEQLAAAGIDAAHIVDAARALVAEGAPAAR
jgi:transketolase